MSFVLVVEGSFLLGSLALSALWKELVLWLIVWICPRSFLECMMYSMSHIFAVISMIHLLLSSLLLLIVWILSLTWLLRGTHFVLSIEIRSSWEENLLIWSKYSGVLMIEIVLGKRRRAFVLRIRNYSFQIHFVSLSCFSLFFLSVLFEDEKIWVGESVTTLDFDYIFKFDFISFWN